MKDDTSDKRSSAERLWKAVIRVTIEVLSELRPLMAEYGLTPPQWANLQVLAEAGPEGLRLSEISRRLRVTEGNITGVIDRLEDSGLAMRVPLPEDRRVIIAQLTPGGRELHARVKPIFAARLEKLFCRLSDGEREALARTLEEVAVQVENARAGQAWRAEESAEVQK